MTPTAKRVAAVGAVTVAIGVGLLVLNRAPATLNAPPYNYCTDAVYYIRSCELSPHSVAAGTPGYAGQICGAHTWAWRGDDLFTYALMDQGGRAYPRPPESAGAALLKVYDDCYKLHLNTWPMGSMCLNAVQPGGTQTYHPITLAQLKPINPGQYAAYFSLFKCAQLTTTPVVSASPVPSQTPTAEAGSCTPREVTRVVTATATKGPPSVCVTLTPAPPCPGCPPERFTPTPRVGP